MSLFGKCKDGADCIVIFVCQNGVKSTRGYCERCETFYTIQSTCLYPFEDIRPYTPSSLEKEDILNSMRRT